VTIGRNVALDEGGMAIRKTQFLKLFCDEGLNGRNILEQLEKLDFTRNRIRRAIGAQASCEKRKSSK
jgi:hypothetical protein